MGKRDGKTVRRERRERRADELPFPNSDDAVEAVSDEAAAHGISVKVLTAEKFPTFRQWRFRRGGKLLLDYWPGTGRAVTAAGGKGFVDSPHAALKAALVVAQAAEA